MQRLMRILKLFSIFFVMLAGIGQIFGNDFLTEVAKIEMWINKKYSQAPITAKLALRKLEKIIEQNGDEQTKLVQLRKTFPEALQRDEKPLIFMPIVLHNIHSLSIGYDIKDSATKVDIIQAITSQKQNKKSSFTQTAGENVNVNTSLRGSAETRLSFNPFKWLSNLSDGGVRISGSFSAGRDAVSRRSQLWSQEEQNLFAREYENIEKMILQTDVTNLHLTFTLTITNNSSENMFCNINDATIPIYMGNTSINNPAKPYKQSGQILLSPKSEKDIVFRVDLDTTTARALIRYMGHSAPDIALLKGNIKIYNANVPDAIREAQKQAETVSLNLFLPEGSVRYNIRKYHTSTGNLTTLREALTAINEDLFDAIQENIFTFDKNGLQTFSSVVLGSFSPDDENQQYYALLQIKDKVYNNVSNTLLDQPLSSESTFWCVDFEKQLNCSAEKRVSIPFEIQTNIFSILRQQAEKGNPIAQNYLGICYGYGIGVAKDEKIEVEWYRKAAEQGLAAAQNNLGCCYAEGIGVAKDEKKAVEWYRKAAEQGDTLAQLKLGMCYDNGFGVVRDKKTAVFWYRKAAEQGVALAQIILGICYGYGIGVAKDEKIEVEWYRKAAEQGLAAAQNNLGCCYAEGIGVAKDEKKAVEWYRKAAEQGDTLAQLKLGMCYDNGFGVVRDKKTAVFWYQKAAEQGVALAQIILGDCYGEGIGVEKDEKIAAEWYQKSAEQGLAVAQNRLGYCYQKGVGVAKDEKKAVEWYQKAAEKGDATAQYNLGKSYYNGIGVAKDETTAVFWYRKAAINQHREAQNDLGYCYDTGRGVEKNAIEAVRWYTTAANAGYAPAQYNLAECYYSGNGVPKNRNMAILWYQQAALQNDTSAKQALRELGEEP